MIPICSFLILLISFGPVVVPKTIDEVEQIFDKIHLHHPPMAGIGTRQQIREGF